MKWVIILGAAGIVILLLSFVASRRYLPRALRYKRAKRRTEAAEELAVNRLIRKLRGLREQLPTELRPRQQLGVIVSAWASPMDGTHPFGCSFCRMWPEIAASPVADEFLYLHCGGRFNADRSASHEVVA